MRHTAIFAVIAALCAATEGSPVSAAGGKALDDVGRGTTALLFTPKGGEDRTAEVLSAVKSGATLRFANGEYHFRSPSKLHYYISNHNNPQPHSVFLPVTNVTDLTILGDGAAFIFHGSGIGMTLMDTRRATVKGIAFDWSRPPFTEARVESAEGERIVLRPDPKQCPVSVEKGRLFAVGEGWHAPIRIIAVFSGDTREAILPTGGFKNPKALDGGAFCVDANMSRLVHPLRKGDVAVLRDTFRPSPGVSLCRAHDTLLEDCSIHGGDGMGLVAQRCENVTVRGSGKAADATAGAFARKCTGRALSLQADTTHFSNCKGHVLVENCLFEGMVDDAINVHSTCLRIERILAPDTLVCRYMHHQSTGFEVFMPGERLRFIKAAKLENGMETIVKDAKITDPLHVTLRLADPVPSYYGAGDAVENADWQPAATFRNNIVRNCYVRAALFTTPGKVVCEGNLFDHVPGQVIQLEGDASGWYESGGCRDVTIRGNVFRGCGYIRGEGLIQIRPNLKDIKAQKVRYHQNILIEGNRFETFRMPLVRGRSVRGLVWRNNEVIYNDDFPPRGKEPFVFDYSEDVEIDTDVKWYFMPSPAQENIVISPCSGG